LLAAFRVDTGLAIIGTTGVILSAAYALYLYRRVVFGALEKRNLQGILDVSRREFVILAPMVVLTIALGVYPKPIFDVTSASVANLVEQFQAGLAAAETDTRLAEAAR
jgi:NADH-quinone oxidoreductase subunit M